MSAERFKVLTFDVVGTLIDFERGIVNYIRKVAGPTAERIGEDAILEAYRRSRAAPEAGWYPDDLVRVYADMAREIGLPATAGEGEGLRDSIRDWPAFPDSVAALARLHRRWRLVAMTNARRWALAHFARTLGEPFDDGVTVDDVRFEKPDPQFFAFARGRLSASGYELEDILHVAQSQYHDIGAARAAGLATAWIYRRHGRPGYGGTQVPPRYTPPDFLAVSLDDLVRQYHADLAA